MHMYMYEPEQCYVIAQMKSSATKIKFSVKHVPFFSFSFSLSLLPSNRSRFFSATTWHLKQMAQAATKNYVLKKKRSKYVPMNKQKSAKRTNMRKR